MNRIQLPATATLCTLALLSPRGAAQSFGPQQIISVGAGAAYSVNGVDLDLDGDPDALVGSLIDNRVIWFENLGGGSFGPSQLISTVVSPYGVLAADLDGDGDPDVLSASYEDDEVTWYENLGGGIFGAQQVIATAADGAVAVDAVDVDGDGHLDVLSASSNDGRIAWYANQGGGTFGYR